MLQFGMAAVHDRLGRPDDAFRHALAANRWRKAGNAQRGITFGRTDELGYNIVENPVHVHDLNATVLHLLSLDHERLTYRYQGRDFRLTDVHGTVVKDLLI